MVHMHWTIGGLVPILCNNVRVSKLVVFWEHQELQKTPVSKKEGATLEQVETGSSKQDVNLRRT